MNKVENFLCIGGVEVANGNRLTSYLQAGLLSASYQGFCDPCSAIDDGLVDYISPIVDAAPWYDANVQASSEFFGILPNSVEVLSAFSRSVTNRPSGGGSIGKLRLRPRVLNFRGMLLATTGPGMTYGESWLREVLAGNRCAEGCSGDEVIYLPACPDPDYDDPRTAFRRLVGAGVTDGPEFAGVDNFPECKLQQVAFQMVSESGYIYRLPERCLDAEPIEPAYDAPISCSLTTLEWAEGGTFKVLIENTGTTTATDIIITGQISLDGSCPVSGLGTSVPPSWSYTIPTLEPDAKLVIDGVHRDVLHYDPSDKFWSSGYAYLDIPPGPFRFPDVGPCTTVCMTIDKVTGDVEATVDTSLREV